MANETIITVIGNVTADPQLTYTQNGLAVVNFTIASTPRSFDKQSGQWQDGEPLFLRSSAWRDMAEHINSTLQKGMRVIAQGQLKQRQYETKDGERRTSLELEIDEIGPSLRFATAQVTRAGGQGQRPAPAGGAGAAGVGTSVPNVSSGAQGAAQPVQASSQDIWGQAPGQYSDTETPF